jgi:hypothetical protein
VRSLNAILAGTTIASYSVMSTEIQDITRPLIEENQRNSNNCTLPLNACPQSQVHRYAWLEYENGAWHFLTSLFADPAESTRRWLDRQCALDELRSEGWIVIRSYHERPSKQKGSENCLYGYGLMITIH